MDMRTIQSSHMLVAHENSINSSLSDTGKHEIRNTKIIKKQSEFTRLGLLLLLLLDNLSLLQLREFYNSNTLFVKFVLLC